jgi:hypothetical protein
MAASRTRSRTLANASYVIPGFMEHPASDRHVFVIRVWRDEGSAADAWRASVLHVASGRRLTSTDLRDVEDFVRLRLGVSPDVYGRFDC